MQWQLINICLLGVVASLPKNDKFNQDGNNDISSKETVVNISEVLVQKIIDGIDTSSIEENLRYLSEKPHLAGSKRDEELAKYIQNKFLEAGFDSAEMVPYDLLLSKPDLKNPNKIYLHNGDEKIFESKHMEEPLKSEPIDPMFIPAYLAFTPAGTIKTPPGVGVVYANYGRMEDFEELQELGVNVTGHIVMARFGEIFRGNKISNAEHYGARGVILFSDPQEVAKLGTDPDQVYDKTFWLPGSGMQRGSTFIGKGDALTPGWPAKSNVYRIPIEDAPLPKIPAQPIGYDDAKVILEKLGGDKAPEEWQGEIEGLSYNLGPNFIQDFEELSLTLTTHNSFNISKNYNVIGIIKGEIEPDRYVIVGNHRDAWGYGAADPSSGTAQILESAKLFGSILKEGKRPRRTLVFCSWGAEEMGLIGSIEWVEEHLHKLQSRAVSYINTDTCASGPMLMALSSPLLFDLIIETTKLVPGVENQTSTLYEEWKSYQELLDPEDEEAPRPGLLIGGSDQVPFAFLAGITSMDIRFRMDKVKHGIILHPGYHTGYETFHMLTKFLDPNFKSIQACSRLSSLIMEILSETPLHPFSLERLPKMMLKSLNESSYRDHLIGIYDKYGELENALIRFDEAIGHFNSRMWEKEHTDLEIRSINDQMRGLEQNFLVQDVDGESTFMKHAAYGLTKYDTYSSTFLPILSDMMYDYDSLPHEEKRHRKESVRKHISDLTIMAERAADFLKEVHLF